MANIILPVRVILPEDEAVRLVPSGVELTVTICGKCCALVPIELFADHDKKVHNA
jgi:hypothetical protein